MAANLTWEFPMQNTFFDANWEMFNRFQKSFQILKGTISLHISANFNDDPMINKKFEPPKWHSRGV